MTTFAPVAMPLDPAEPIEVRPDDVDVDADGRIVLRVRRKGRVVAAYAAPAGASVVAARQLVDRRSSAVVAATGRAAHLPPQPEPADAPHATTGLWAATRAALGAPRHGMWVGLALLVFGAAGCGWLAAEIRAQRAHATATEVR